MDAQTRVHVRSTTIDSRLVGSAAHMVAKDDEALLLAHDALLRTAKVELWLGAEPTFTDARSDAAEWIGEALGPTKLAMAEKLWARLRRPGDLALRTLGRQYPGEDAPRFCLGLYGLRDAPATGARGGRRPVSSPLWTGPVDPALLEGQASTRSPERVHELARRLRDVLVTALEGERLDVLGDRFPYRAVVGGRASDPRCRRPPLDGYAIPEEGLVDSLALEGVRLFCVGVERGAPAIELPAFGDVDLFLAFLGVLAAACAKAEVDALVLRGHPPPADARVRFTTLTPDPGVVEVNMAPCRDLAELSRDMHAIDDAARSVGLSAERRHFNGEVTDSGGGGHLTFGASTAERSPFFLHPALLPRLLAYLNQHPSLSYFFGGHAAGSAGQSPRSDESTPELFGELDLALDRLVRTAHTPLETDAQREHLWAELAPFLADRFGNTHRSEVNVEKLWNPWLPGRGKLGVIELRALRQAPSTRHAVARAALFRSILARLAAHDFPVALRAWGGTLHDRFALPYYLETDLREVLGDLERAGFALPAPFADELFDDRHRVLGQVDLGDPSAPVTLTVRRALEHWPLVGDLSKQGGTSRLVDASTQRLELRVEGPSERVGRVRLGARDGDATIALPMVLVEDGAHTRAISGVRYRAFVPTVGLHPGLAARDPLELVISTHAASYALAIHSWIPGGGVYAGLPSDDAEAATRRLQRFVLTPLDVAPTFEPAPRGATTRHTLDTRRL